MRTTLVHFVICARLVLETAYVENCLLPEGDTIFGKHLVGCGSTLPFLPFTLTTHGPCEHMAFPFLRVVSLCSVLQDPSTYKDDDGRQETPEALTVTIQRLLFTLVLLHNHKVSHLLSTVMLHACGALDRALWSLIVVLRKSRGLIVKDEFVFTEAPMTTQQVTILSMHLTQECLCRLQNTLRLRCDYTQQLSVPDVCEDHACVWHSECASRWLTANSIDHADFKSVRTISEASGLLLGDPEVVDSRDEVLRGQNRQSNPAKRQKASTLSDLACDVFPTDASQEKLWELSSYTSEAQEQPSDAVGATAGDKEKKRRSLMQTLRFLAQDVLFIVQGASPRRRQRSTSRTLRPLTGNAATLFKNSVSDVKTETRSSALRDERRLENLAVASLKVVHRLTQHLPDVPKDAVLSLARAWHTC
jgi:hypothetical protein